jgi:hypothetical protein
MDVAVVSIWIPVSSALAALLGGGFGAMLQGRYGISDWRRQTRLQAYTRFLETVHDFDDCVIDALEAAGESDFDEKWQKVVGACWQMGRAGTMTQIAGPFSIDIAAQEVVLNAKQILEDGKDLKVIVAIAAGRKQQKPYGKLLTCLRSAEDFGAIARRELRTQGRLKHRRVYYADWPEKKYWPKISTERPEAKEARPP